MITYKECKPTIERILKQAKQEIELQHKYKPDSLEFKKALEERARELAKIEKQRLSKKFNVEVGNEFYRLFEVDLKEAVK